MTWLSPAFSSKELPDLSLKISKQKLVNSTQVTYHSLVLDEREDRERIAEELMYLANGEDIPLQFPPQYINVIVNAADPADFLDMT